MKKITVLKISALILFAIGVWFIFQQFDTKDKFQEILQWVEELGLWAPVFFVGLYLCTAGILLPVVVLTIGAGVLFGIIGGTILITFAYCLSASILFLISRNWSRSSLAKKLENNPKFEAIDKAIENDGWKIVAMLRFVPILNSNIVNYACGLTRISLQKYLLGTFLGIFPGAIMYAYVGFLMGDISTMDRETNAKSTVEWVLLIFGLAATIFTTVYITQKVKKALPENIRQTKEEDDQKS